MGRRVSSGQSTEVPYLASNERSGHDISLRLDVDAGVNIEEFTCVTHRISRDNSKAGHLVVTLDYRPNRIPNKDFVLRYRVAGEHIKSDLITHRDERGGYFTMMLYPPQALEGLGRVSLEMVFVLG